MVYPPVTARILTSLNTYFFTFTRFHNLGLLRLVLIPVCLKKVYFLFGNMDRAASLGERFVLIHEPSTFVGLLTQALSLPFPVPDEYTKLVGYCFYAIGGCAAVGLFTRPALLAFGLMYIYLIDIFAARGLFNHEASLITQVILGLALVPGSTSFSADNFLKWLRYRIAGNRTRSLTTVLLGPAVPVWGVRLLLILLAVTYFTSGLSKIRFTGIKWLNGQTLAYYLDGSASPQTEGPLPVFIGPGSVPEEKKWRDGFGIHAYSYGNRQQDELMQKAGKTIASIPVVIAGVSIATVLFELAGVLVLVGGWTRVLYLIGAILLHKSIGALMNLSFVNYQLLCLLLIDWQWVYWQIRADYRQRMELRVLNQLNMKREAISTWFSNRKY